MDSTNPPLLRILMQVTLALTLSALLLLGLFVANLQSGLPANPEPPIEVPGKDFQAVVGSAEVRGGELVFTGYGTRNGESTAVAVRRGRLQADAYPLLKYQVGPGSPGLDLNLVWRTSSNPRVLFNTELDGSREGPSWLDLSGNPDWQGTVLEFGIYAIVSDAAQPVTLSSLSLEPAGWRGALGSLWSDWTYWGGWTAGSINFLYGTTDPDALSPVLAAATWSALAAVLLLAWGVVTKRVLVAALAGVLLVPWVALDLLWQNKLVTQLAATQALFADKTEHEKHLADIDGYIYSYIKRLKDKVLPTNPARIVILQATSGHNFERLKTQYYLLPHNVYNFGRLPPNYGLDSVDYILVLGEIGPLAYRDSDKVLVWKRGRRVLPAELVDSDPLGKLYRLLPVQARAQ